MELRFFSVGFVPSYGHLILHFTTLQKIAVFLVRLLRHQAPVYPRRNRPVRREACAPPKEYAIVPLPEDGPSLDVDRRPMRDHPQAMAQLRTLLEERTPLYGQADFVVDTQGLDVATIVQEIQQFFGG